MTKLLSSLPVYSVLFLSLFVVSQAQGQDSERILDFRSEITVNRDSSMIVRETIIVNVQGQRIQRGIVRDFPTKYETASGTRIEVGFDVQEVLRDGSPEPFRLEDLSNGVRVRIGRGDYLLPPGEYAYTLVYRTTRQLGYFDQHDELYWNVTGNGWDFAIDNASATITLPDGIAESSLRLVAYTGPQDGRGTDYSTEILGPSEAFFATTRPLAPREGLTVVISFPKGFVEKPAPAEELTEFLVGGLRKLMEPVRGDFVMFGGIVLLLLYYGLAWVRVGIDPPKGRILPREQPPDDLSPQALRYIERSGYDQKMFSVALINMAVKGYLRIEQEGEGKLGTYYIVRLSENDESLSEDERAIADSLFDYKDTIELKTANHGKIGIALAHFLKSLKEQHHGVYFHRNLLYLLPGLLIAMMTVGVAGATYEGDAQEVAYFMCVWLSLWSIGVCALIAAVLGAWKNVFRGMASFGAAIFLSLFSLPFIGGEVLAIAVLVGQVSLYFPLGILAIVIISAIFIKLIKAPTQEGRRVLDEIEGFKMYLEGEGTSAFSYHSGSETLEKRFERYLPFAIALGMEEPWTEEFTRALDASPVSSAAYSPLWYQGTAWNTLGASAFTTSLNDSLSQAVVSSASPPGSSSGGGGFSSSGGGGGGSSGGGGGGGGGGGW